MKKKQIKSPVNLDDILHKEHATIVNAKATNELDSKNSKPNGMEKKMLRLEHWCIVKMSFQF